MRFSVTLLALATFFVAPAIHAQSRLIDDLIAQEYYKSLGQQIGTALQTAAEVKRGMAEMNGDIQQARRSFWVEYERGIRNGAAEAEFGRRLLAKDLILASLNISGGTQNVTVLGFSAIFGQLDGGVPRPATVQFEEWINAIRFVLGASKPNAPVFATPAQLRSALEKTTPWYDVYRQWRDWAELSAHGIKRPQPTAEAPGPNALTALRPSSAPGWRMTSQELFPLVGPAYPLLRCTYTSTADGRTMLFFFWHQKVSLTRAQVQSAVAANPQSGMAILLSASVSPPDLAVSECPADWEKAQELSRKREAPSIEGKWALRREGGDPTLQGLFGGSSPAETVQFMLVGKRLTVLGSRWNAVGEFDGQKGYYETVHPNGGRSRTDLVLDETGVLHGKVRGSGVFEWDFAGTRTD